jgi:2,3-bisphosphoglycerate-independent phosphoglycerate mutase
MERTPAANGPLLLVVIDGFGLAPPGDGNAITRARTPNWDRLRSLWPSTALSASGLDVGLPAGVMGNSEVGHLNVGAGRVIPQDIVRIDEAVSGGALFDNTALLAAVRSVAGAPAAGGGAQGSPRLHLMGLHSDGRVHSSDVHVRALVDLAARHLPPERVCVHPFTDGRDTPPRSADRYVAELAAHCRGKATIATVCGRYFAMDRDKRWDRTERAYRAIVGGVSPVGAADAPAAVAAAYARGESDEFIQPTVLDAVRGRGPLVRKGDAVVFWNFRADRARQMCAALNDAAFAGFARDGHALISSSAPGVHLVSLTEYDEKQTWPSAFPPVAYTDLLADVWSRAGLRQLRIAETEKYAHVTYFFNGRREAVLPGEERILVPSPKVATYDLAPEMSAPEVTDRLAAELAADRFDAVVLNFANPDMVGHSGVIPATIRAVEVVDACLGRLAETVLGKGGLVAVTADHGNAEQMLDPATGQPHTAHTTNPVPFLVAGAARGLSLAPGGRLADVAPTLLSVTGISKPAAMTGRSLAVTA